MLKRIPFATFVSPALTAMLLFALPTFVRAQDNPESQPKSVVPVFKLTGPLTESPAADDLPIFGPPQQSLKSLLERMHKAAKDPGVKAVVLMSENASLGSAQIEEVRQAIGRVRDAGKDVFVHSDSAMLGQYVLFTAATRFSMSPTADVWIGGLHAEQPYVRGLLDKIGVEPDIISLGDYKSAGEMFMRTGPSKPAEEMTNWLLDSIYGSWVEQIAKSRKMAPDQVREKLDVGMYTAEKAKEAGLIDAVEDQQDFEAAVKNKVGGAATFDHKYGKPADKQLDLSSPMAMFKIWGELLGGAKEKKPSGPAVGIVYVDGMIFVGSKEPSPFGGGDGAASTDVRNAVIKALEDDSIKAVVLRVDSPGGSAVASDIILNATKRLAAKKPFVVSMGDVAGSGGYYVACGADTIFADETTLTASIGVLGGKLVTTPMWEKIGVTWKEYNRGKNADLLSTSHKFSDEQRTVVKTWMEDVYGVFKKHVTEARGNRLKKPLDEIAGGRVYTGKQALELGLVDQIGTMSDAIKFVAKKANLGSDYAVRVVPEPKNFVEQLMEGLSGDKSGEDSKHVQLRLPGTRTSLNVADLALPMLKQVDPQKADGIRTVLKRLDLMQQENVILSMPEVRVGE